eukprot:13862290-Alexandrium_andersonii.AAC.1
MRPSRLLCNNCLRCWITAPNTMQQAAHGRWIAQKQTSGAPLARRPGLLCNNYLQEACCRGGNR